MPKYRIKRYIVNVESKSAKIKAAINYYSRKERYMEHDIKRERIFVDAENEKVVFYPGREDSYERLSENDVQFRGGESAEDSAIKKILIEKMWEEIEKLSDEERNILLLTALQGKSQNELSDLLGINQSTVSRKLKAIRRKLKAKLGDFL